MLNTVQVITGVLKTTDDKGDQVNWETERAHIFQSHLDINFVLVVVVTEGLLKLLKCNF